ncbi:VgrG-related protein [Gloeobacter morelensis]|uniref:VgrG-related protein n=1 Tax=Gloeobacter morelensis MG652769 TaxID=2781736 RepID=A0ABY3PPJ0_9CYAN|nr:VgrG-related protein [Gloeobacter morelensis]UFP95459.1 VgrG-related protein [Gloeobacter morelensis MG652769]
MPKYNSKPNITIDGMSGEDTDQLAISTQQICVEESLHLPDAFTLILHNPFTPGRMRDIHHWINHPALKVGAKITFGFRAATTTAPEFVADNALPKLLVGEITGIETHFTEDPSAPMVLRGYDMSHRLHKGRFNRSFVNMTDSDIVRKIVAEVGLQAGGEIEESGIPHDYVFQENQTNMAFLRERAARIGFEFFVQDEQVHFHRPRELEPVQLRWGVRLNAFRVRMSTAEQVSSVEVRSWDYTEKKTIVATAQSEQVVTRTGYEPGSSSNSQFDLQPKLVVVDHPVFNAQEADTMAQAICDEMGGEYIFADARAEGEPKVRPGRLVKLVGLGEKLTGDYYVTDARHLYHDLVYTTEFSVRGTRGGNLMTGLSPQPKLKPGQTNLVGIVTNNKDPEGMGRVKVKFPTLTEEHESNWARVVGPGAGPKHGIYWMPEVNDEVLVCFEHGDIHRPYVVGGVWNGKDDTPETVDDSLTPVKLRTMKTRVGHYLRFADEDTPPDKKGIYIRTADNYQIQINETDQFMELRTPGGCFIKLDDATGSITIEAPMTVTIKAGQVFIN